MVPETVIQTEREDRRELRQSATVLPLISEREREREWVGQQCIA